MQTEILTEYTTLIDRLTDARRSSENAFFTTFLNFDIQTRARLITELPETYQRELCSGLSTKKLAKMFNFLRTDDATDMMIILKEVDEAKWLSTIELMESKLTEAIKALMDYAEDESGALMEIEIFTVTKNETVGGSMKRLGKLVDNHALEHVSNIYLVDREHRLMAIFALEQIATAESSLTYADLYDKSVSPLSIHSRSSIDEAARLMKRYDLSVLPVINKNGRLLGRITHDDMMDYLQEDATKQIYGLSHVDPEEEIEEGVMETGKDRALWLFVNLINATLVSIVIGFFEHSLQKVVALAVLMPIVANMAGTASMQTLTVLVRQMALGNVVWGDAAVTLFKELKIALINGLFFAVLAMLIAYVWFGSWYIGGVMAASMFISFISAGVLGAYVPLALKSLRIDPAIASSVIVITLVDVIGFFSFLWFATIWIPEINS
ncbi:MAG: magnesium transporter [Campylobacterota bacterium]|nr:magnesium transporter [Campylobacterota bacterium]